MGNQESQENDELEIQHRTYIEEEEINISEFPNVIKSAMRNFNAKLKKYEDFCETLDDDNLTEEEEEKQSEMFFELQQDDVAIADDILTWWEDKNAEEEEEIEEEEEEEIEEEEEVAPVVVAPVVVTDEQKLMALIKDNQISVTDLTNLIGDEPEYPEQQIGNIRLRKMYLKPFYQII